MLTGTPVNLPCGCPEDQAAVARSAAARACSYAGVTTTLQEAWVASSAEITSSMTSRGVNRLVR